MWEPRQWKGVYDLSKLNMRPGELGKFPAKWQIWRIFETSQIVERWTKYFFSQFHSKFSSLSFFVFHLQNKQKSVKKLRIRPCEWHGCEYNACEKEFTACLRRVYSLVKKKLGDWPCEWEYNTCERELPVEGSIRPKALRNSEPQINLIWKMTGFVMNMDSSKANYKKIIRFQTTSETNLGSLQKYSRDITNRFRVAYGQNIYALQMNISRRVRLILISGSILFLLFNFGSQSLSFREQLII